MLGMRLNNDISFAYLSKSWLQTQPDYLSPRKRPFMCALKDNQLLIYGGYDYAGISGGVIIDMTKNKEVQIEQNDELTMESYSHGVVTSKGVALGIGGNRNW